MDCGKTAIASKMVDNIKAESSQTGIVSKMADNNKRCEAGMVCEVAGFNKAEISEPHLCDAPQVGLQITRQGGVRKNAKSARRKNNVL